jgi:DNA-binding transcriptional regulator YiaG
MTYRGLTAYSASLILLVVDRWKSSGRIQSLSADGQELKRRREELGFTQARFASRLTPSVDQPTVARWESGARRLPAGIWQALEYVALEQAGILPIGEEAKVDGDGEERIDGDNKEKTDDGDEEQAEGDDEEQVDAYDEEDRVHVDGEQVRRHLLDAYWVVKSMPAQYCPVNVT